MENRFRVGIFTTTHGIKGEIKVYPTTDDIRRFDSLKRVILETLEGDQLLTVAGVRYQKDQVILRFKEIGDINQIEKWKGASLYVTREDAVKLPPNRYFIADILGSRVVTEEGRELGTLKDVLQTGANDVFVVAGEKDGKPKEYLIPHIKDCVLDVRPEEGLITVHMLEGLEDL